MNKNQIILREFGKVMGIVAFGLVVIFPLIDMFKFGFTRSISETFIGLYSQTTLTSVLGLLFIAALLTIRRSWYAINLQKDSES